MTIFMINRRKSTPSQAKSKSQSQKKAAFFFRLHKWSTKFRMTFGKIIIIKKIHISILERQDGRKQITNASRRIIELPH